MYTKKHELYSGIWFGELRAEFEPGVSLVDYVCMYVCVYIYMCVCVCVCVCTGRFIMFSVITNINNRKTKGPTLMELFTATGKLKKFFFFDN